MTAPNWSFPARPVRLAATVAAAIVAASSIAASVLAQEAAKEETDGDAAALINLKFPGGSALDYVEAIRRATGDLNILVAPEAAEVRVPAVTLNRVSRQAALELLSGRYVRSPTHSIELEVQNMTAHEPFEQPTFQIIAEVHGNQPHSESRVWTVRALVDGGVSSEAILSAVELAMEMAGAADALDVRFHQETALLMARGEQEQLAVVEQVTLRLRQSLQEREQNEAAALRAGCAGLQNQIVELQQIVQAKEVELDQLRIQLQQLRNERPGNPR